VEKKIQVAQLACAGYVYGKVRQGVKFFLFKFFILLIFDHKNLLPNPKKSPQEKNNALTCWVKSVLWK
jgi:hypothetical protein